MPKLKIRHNRTIPLAKEVRMPIEAFVIKLIALLPSCAPFPPPVATLPLVDARSYYAVKTNVADKKVWDLFCMNLIGGLTLGILLTQTKCSKHTGPDIPPETVVLILMFRIRAFLYKPTRHDTITIIALMMTLSDFVILYHRWR